MTHSAHKPKFRIVYADKTGRVMSAACISPEERDQIWQDLLQSGMAIHGVIRTHDADYQWGNA